jgi:predicted MFS family arabinose efflux permease
MLMALARSWHTAIPGMILYRCAAAAAPAIMAFAMLSIPDRSLPGIPERTLSTIWAAWPAAQVASPWLGGIIAQNTSIRTTMWVAATVLALAIGLVLLTKPARAQSSPQTQGSLSVLRNRRYLLLTGYFALTTMVLYLGHMLLPTYLQETRGFSLATIGFLFTVSSGGAVVLNLVAGRKSPRWSFAGLLVLVWLAYLVLWRTYAVWSATAAMFMLGAIPATWIVTNACIVQVVGDRDQGRAFGIFQSLAHAGPALAAWMAGQLYGMTPGHALPLVAALAGIPVLLALWFVPGLGSSVAAPASAESSD